MGDQAELYAAREAERLTNGRRMDLETKVFDALFPDREESNLQEWARSEIAKVGLADPDSDYNGMIGVAVLQLIKVFAAQGHGGFSAGLTIEAFKRLASYQSLSGEPDPVLEPTT